MSTLVVYDVALMVYKPQAVAAALDDVYRQYGNISNNLEHITNLCKKIKRCPECCNEYDTTTVKYKCNGLRQDVATLILKLESLAKELLAFIAKENESGLQPEQLSINARIVAVLKERNAALKARDEFKMLEARMFAEASMFARSN